jgi:hypothetical protein
VLIARSFNGVKVALLPLQVTLAAATGECLNALSRNVFLFIDPHFIGKLKFTVTLVLTGTLKASSIGFVETTTGLIFFDEPAADVPPAHTMITNAAIETLLTKYLSIIVRCFDSPQICPTSTRQGLCPTGAF